MDSKIILAILVVALIGVVAATYHTETNDAINSLANVATENSPEESTTDILEAESSSVSDNAVTTDEDTVKPEKSTTTTSKNKKQVASSSASSTKSNNQVSTSKKTKPSNSSNVQSYISKSKAESIAKSKVSSQYPGATTSAKLNGKYYLVTLKNNGKVIGELEIDAISGKVTGGAMVDEVPDPDEYYKSLGQLDEG